MTKPLKDWEVRAELYSLPGYKSLRGDEPSTGRVNIDAFALLPVPGRKRRVRASLFSGMGANMPRAAWDQLKPVLENAGAKVYERERER